MVKTMLRISSGLFLSIALAALPSHAQDFGKYSVEAGGSFYPSSEPHLAGHVSLLVAMDDKTFSFTTLEMRGVGAEQPIQSTRTGFARLIEKNKYFALYGLADGGVAMSSDSTSGAFAGGGLIGFHLAGPLQAVVGIQTLNAGGAIAGSGWNTAISIGFRLAP